ncbi:unnamed protein product [Phytomonas sp. Hart1]|nr:unnamed protein product [Phytomonas sp. Hart1]|eukprot:CCW70335.1 unnamed protein product [Phytomonas sp. isolate Hart1]
MQKYTYMTSLVTNSQEGSSSTTESDGPSDHVCVDISAKFSTHNSNSEVGKIHAPSSSSPHDNNIKVSNSQETRKGSSEMPTKIDESNASTVHSPHLSASQKAGLTRTVLSKALCTINKAKKKRIRLPHSPGLSTGHAARRRRIAHVVIL